MKQHSEYICQQCGYKSASFYGKCPQCGEWNSLVETSVSTETQGQRDIGTKYIESLVKLAEVKSQKANRMSTGFGEFDRVLGGGVVPGEIVLISGDPGIGKSTLLLQAAMAVAKGTTGSKGTTSTTGMSKKTRDTRDTLTTRDTSVLYVTGEESAQQVKIRADRLVSRPSGNQDIRTSGKKKPENLITRLPDNLFILPITSVEGIVAASEKIAPALLIIDSIQTLTSERLSGSAGSVGQVRECAGILQRHAKQTHTPIFVVGHVTKEGNIAGPKVLEHVVDAVLNLEGDGMHAYRLLRSVKNRFGSTFEVGVFEMTDGGMLEVLNPSEIFLAQRIAKRPGSAICATIAGGRPLICEVQALSTSTIFGVPTRRVTGLDFSRMQIVIAALSRAASLSLSSLDVYLNVAGGLKIDEPAADLAAALAIASAVQGVAIAEEACAFGEVGLLGELRPVSYAKNRIEEAKRIGFGDFITPERFKTLEEAVSYALHGE
ncbi:DNA repair protein RadA [Candidatus Curtissbacteria bacterium]|nr:DNA repair protein RadA [Candidatus Curtissbacteria bacterium]